MLNNKTQGHLRSHPSSLGLNVNYLRKHSLTYQSMNTLTVPCALPHSSYHIVIIISTIMLMLPPLIPELIKLT